MFYLFETQEESEKKFITKKYGRFWDSYDYKYEYEALYEIEEEIMNKKIDLDHLDKKIQYAKSRLEGLRKMPTFILIKLM